MAHLTARVAERPALPPDAPPGTGLAADRPPASRVLRPTILGEVAVVLLLLRAYDMIRVHAEVRTKAALRNGWDLLHVERLLHIDLESAVNRWTSLHHAVSLAASYWYQFFHISITLLVLLWCYWRRPGSYRRARNALVLTNVFGLAFFLLYPAAPPRFLPGAGFIDAVAQAGFGTSHGGPVTADQYGAFPSLHLAWAVWTAVVAARLVRPAWLRRLWLSYPLITASAVVATGNHYVLDVLAGIGIALISLALAYRYPRSRQYGRTGSARSVQRRLRAILLPVAVRLRVAVSKPADLVAEPPAARQPATVAERDCA
ncbi:MAG: phosphatase PAP2 family protein [Jatrophihabitantaceae bacterium]